MKFKFLLLFIFLTLQTQSAQTTLPLTQENLTRFNTIFPPGGYKSTGIADGSISSLPSSDFSDPEERLLKINRNDPSLASQRKEQVVELLHLLFTGPNKMFLEATLLSSSKKEITIRSRRRRLRLIVNYDDTTQKFHSVIDRESIQYLIDISDILCEATKDQLARIILGPEEGIIVRQKHVGGNRETMLTIPSIKLHR